MRFDLSLVIKKQYNCIISLPEKEQDCAKAKPQPPQKTVLLTDKTTWLKILLRNTKIEMVDSLKHEKSNRYYTRAVLRRRA